MRGRLSVAAVLLVLVVCSCVAAREWTDHSGQKFDGKFVRFDDGNVVILVSGQTQSIPFDNLSDADQQFVRQTLENKGQGDLLPAAKGGGNSGNAQPAFSDSRTWTDREGNKYQGKFDSLSGADVQIADAAGSTSIPFDQLTRTDQEVVRQNLESQGQGELTPPVAGDSPTASLREWQGNDNKTFFAKLRTVVLVKDDKNSETPAAVLQGSTATIVMPYADLSAQDQQHIRQDLETRKLEHLLAGVAPPAPSATSPATQPADSGARTWTDLAGNAYQGTFVRTRENAVIIRQQEGTNLSINCEALSIADQNHVVQVLEQRDPTSDDRQYRIWSYNTGSRQAVACFEQSVGASVHLKQEAFVFTIPYSQLSPSDQRYVDQVAGATSNPAVATPDPGVMPDPSVMPDPAPPAAPPSGAPPMTEPAREPWPVGQPSVLRDRTWRNATGNTWRAQYYDVSQEGFVSFNDPVLKRQWAVHFYDLGEPDQQFIRDDLNGTRPRQQQQKEEEDEDRLFYIKETYHPPLWTYFLFGLSVLALVVAIIIKVIERLTSSRIL